MTRGASWSQHEGNELAVHAELEASGVVHPVDFGGYDEVLWMDCELASFAENRLGDCADPRGLDAARREVWRARATTEPIAPPSQRAYDRCYWLLRCGERVGTVALTTSSFGGSALTLSSLYVFPTHRGSGIATRACAAMSNALGRHEYALRLSTNWSWQKAVRLYVRMGMWLRMWKRDLEFHWHTREPAPVVEVTDVRACLSVVVHERKVLLAQAVREVDRLVSFEHQQFDDSDLAAVAWNAGTTLSLAMALAGWPLVRSSESWERHRYSDAVSPESLAYKSKTRNLGGVAPLTATQRRALAWLAKDHLLDGLYLAGGVAVAHYLEHRHRICTTCFELSTGSRKPTRKRSCRAALPKSTGSACAHGSK